jgi:hypothetical protein
MALAAASRARTASTLHTLWPMPPLLPVTTASFITSDSVNGPGRGARCASFDQQKTALCEGTERPRSALWRPSAECFLGSVCREACTRAGVAFYNAEIDSEFAAFDAGTARLGAELAKLKAAQPSWSAAMRLLLTATQAASMDDVAARLVLPEGRLPLCVAAPCSALDTVPAEAGARCLLAAAASLEAAWVERRESAQRALGDNSSLDMVAVDAEARALYSHFRRFVAEALLVLHFLAARGSCRDYLDAAADVARELARFVDQARQNMSDQRAWYARQCASGALRPLSASVRPHEYKQVLETLGDRLLAVHVTPVQLHGAAC